MFSTITCLRSSSTTNVETIIENKVCVRPKCVSNRLLRVCTELILILSLSKAKKNRISNSLKSDYSLYLTNVKSSADWSVEQ